MKNQLTNKSLLITALTFLLISTSAFAQVPQKMSYQAVIRDNNSKLVSSQKVGLRISILKGSANGSAVYEETQTPTSNDNGLVSIEIGSGNVVSGDFAAIDWANGSYFIKTETDPAGGTSYTITGTNQLLSVPYALHSKTADSLTGSSGYSIGDSTQGGIIFWVDPTGQHGLVCAKSDQSSGVRWFAGTNTKTMALGDGLYAGKTNTTLIIASQKDGDGSTYAALLCDTLQITEGGKIYGDWYLPSKYELNLLYLQRTKVGGFAKGLPYWSSSEYGIGFAWALYFSFGNQNMTIKGTKGRIRAVRAF